MGAYIFFEMTYLVHFLQIHHAEMVWLIFEMKQILGGSSHIKTYRDAALNGSFFQKKSLNMGTGPIFYKKNQNKTKQKRP